MRVWKARPMSFQVLSDLGFCEPVLPVVAGRPVLPASTTVVLASPGVVGVGEVDSGVVSGVVVDVSVGVEPGPRVLGVAVAPAFDVVADVFAGLVTGVSVLEVVVDV